MVQVLLNADDCRLPPTSLPPFLPPTSRHLVVAHHSSSIDSQERGKEIYCLKWFAGAKTRPVCIEERQQKVCVFFLICFTIGFCCDTTLLFVVVFNSVHCMRKENTVTR